MATTTRAVTADVKVEAATVERKSTAAAKAATSLAVSDERATTAVTTVAEKASSAANKAATADLADLADPVVVRNTVVAVNKSLVEELAASPTITTLAATLAPEVTPSPADSTAQTTRRDTTRGEKS